MELLSFKEVIIVMWNITIVILASLMGTMFICTVVSFINLAFLMLIEWLDKKDIQREERKKKGKK